MRNVAFYLLCCFVFVLPWEEFVQLPLLGSIPRLIGLVASAVGVLHILVRRRIKPLSWFHVFAVLFVLWAGVSSFWSIDPEATRARFMTYLQLVVLVWLIWEIAWSPERQRALLQAYVLGACVAAAANIYNYLSGVSYDDPARFTSLNQHPSRHSGRVLRRPWCCLESGAAGGARASVSRRGRGSVRSGRRADVPPRIGLPPSPPGDSGRGRRRRTLLVSRDGGGGDQALAAL